MGKEDIMDAYQKLDNIKDLEKYNYIIIDKDKSITNNIKEILKEKELTQSDLSKLTGISRQIISDIVQNKLKPGIDFAIKIAYVLNKSVEEVFKLDENAWYEVVREKDDISLFIDIYTLTLIDNINRKIMIDSGEDEYYLLQDNKTVNTDEYRNMLNEYIKNNKSREIYRNELIKEFDENICTKRFKKLGKKINPIVNKM